MDIEERLARGDFLAIDVEGDGGHPRQGPLEIALVRHEAGEVASVRVWLVNPGRPIDPFVTGMHGIGDADVAHLPPFAAIGDEFREAVEGSFLVGHVLKSDMDMLEQVLPDVRSLPAAMMDTQKLARAVLQTQKSNLEAVSDLLGLADVPLAGRGGAHTAERDARLAGAVFLKLAAMLPTKPKHRASILDRTTIRPTFRPPIQAVSPDVAEMDDPQDLPFC